MVLPLLRQSKKKNKTNSITSVLKIIPITWKIPGKQSNQKKFLSRKRQINDQEQLVLDTKPLLIPEQMQIFFNSYFCSVTPEIQSEVPFSYKTFFECLPSTNQDSCFISSCTKEEIIEAISNKSAGPNNIHTKILRLVRDDISEHLLIIFNISFAIGIIFEKVARIIPVHKKDSKQEFSNYKPISFLSNFDKILEILMHKILIKFLSEGKNYLFQTIWL